MDEFRDFDDLIKRLLEQSGIGQGEKPATYGFRIIITGGEASTTRGSWDEDVIEPVAEVHCIDDEIFIVSELPGATLDGIGLDVKDDLLMISAETDKRTYKTTVRIPPVEKDSMHCSYKNGVLEVSFRRAAPIPPT
jgi:HSP20 family molecular chaperone IbpA